MFNSDDGLVPVEVEAGFDPFRARVAMGGFLAGYSGKTVEAYALDLRQWSQWCLDHDLELFEVRRAHIELFARWLEGTGRAKSTVARRLSTITGFYRYCTEEQLMQAAISGGRNHALACLLALNGLRISEALGADIEHLGVVRGHRTLAITRKGGAIVTVPLAPRTGRAIDLCIGERDQGSDPD